MNIESIIEKFNVFDELVVDSGMKRDIQDFTTAINQNQNRNIAFMQGLVDKLIAHLEIVKSNSLQNDLDIVLKNSKPFTDLESLDKLKEILEDPSMDSNTFYTNFYGILNTLQQAITSNENEVDEMRVIFNKYTSKKEDYKSDKDQGLVSLIFKDKKTTKDLKHFSKSINRWNRTLLSYHTLLKSESPESVSLIGIQQGSIDVIINIDFDIAINFAELVKVGLITYSSYLLYKSEKAREIIDSYLGNVELIEGEKKRDSLMLENIRQSIERKAREQHDQKLVEDPDIDTNSIDVKISEISTAILDHIIKGNEVKLLSPPSEEKENLENDIAEQLREKTAIARDRYSKLNSEEKLLLLEKYEIKEE